ncbi:Lrp/AsnC family transcriptional regulator [Snodgrassella sp. B3882]|uniref:Lrp/AsnC family transcriptional regulator n=1 Tax=Snodgrassella sp. B3882 TaxID=2818037 RepID=UPI002269BF04|nr:Lrp/AsnC family transcriptional regulator [Snodgrassella sp. B3882]MCX8745085.1 Lrp/AsnC family transcriptional regulator [Snodgrassella sp. B3882]
MKLDNIDKRILRTLQREGNIQNNELAKKVGLSPSPCLRRVKILEESGFIKQYVALLDKKAINKQLIVYVRIKVDIFNNSSAAIERFIYEVKLLSQIQECYVMAGENDFLLRVICEDLEEYRNFQVHTLALLPGVCSIRTEIPLQVVKWTTEIDI